MRGGDIVWEWEPCERCDGDGGPPSFWDEETCRWHHYVCGSCGGAGGRMSPVD
jgi:hypothetical protein